MLGTRRVASGANPPGAWRAFAEAGILPDLSAMHFVARAITPPNRPRRFDSRFFIADITAVAHRAEGFVGADKEFVELVWMPLAEAASLDIPAITRIVLKELDAAMKVDMAKTRPRPFFYERNRVWRRDEL